MKKRYSFPRLLGSLLITLIAVLLIADPALAKKKKKKKKPKGVVTSVWYADVTYSVKSNKKKKSKKKKRAKTKTIEVACATSKGVKAGPKNKVKAVKNGFKFTAYSKLAKKISPRSKKARDKKKLYALLAKRGKAACKAVGSTVPAPGGDGGGDGQGTAPVLSFTPYSGEFGMREAHILYSRFAFGASYEELQQAVARGMDATVERLLTWQNEAGIEAQALDIECDRFLAVEDEWGEEPGDDNRKCNSLNPLDFSDDGLHEGYYWRFIHSPNPFFYKFMTFIHSERMAAQSDTLPDSRRHFAKIHYQFLMDFARNLDYGWFIRNVKEDPLVSFHNLNRGENSVFNVLTPPNQDLAREYVELASMSPEDASGNPNYNILDIIALANALSGSGYNMQEVPVGDDENGDPQVVIIENPAFIPNAFVSGPKELFVGTPFQTTIVTADDAADAILSHPETHYHMAEELIYEYISRDASIASIQEISNIIQADNGKLRRAIKTLMTSSALYSAEHDKNLAKTGFEVIVGFLRATGYPVNQRSLSEYFGDIGQRLGEPGNNPAGRIFGWLTKELNGEVFVIERRNIFTSMMNYSDSHFENYNYSIYDSLIASLPTDMPAAEALVDRLNVLFRLRLNSAQKARFVRYLNYNWETCNGNEPELYGCVEGEKFAKREAFDAAPDAPNYLMRDKVQGALALATTLDEFFIK